MWHLKGERVCVCNTGPFKGLEVFYSRLTFLKLNITLKI